MTNIVVIEGTGTLGLEFTSKETCQRQIDGQVRGGFKRKDYEIMTIREVKEMYLSHRLNNCGFTKQAWGIFTRGLYP